MTVPGEIVPVAAPAVPLDATVSLTVKHPAVGMHSSPDSRYRYIAILHEITKSPLHWRRIQQPPVGHVYLGARAEGGGRL